MDAWDIDVFSVKLVETGAAMMMKFFVTDVAETRKMNDLDELEFKIVTFNDLIGETLLIDLGEMKQTG